MLEALREFVLVGGTKTSAEGFPEVTDPRFTLGNGAKSRAVRRTWLDTFDWRLFRAGLTLELVSDQAGSELVLSARDGEQVAAQGHPSPAGGEPGARISPPCLVEDLPVGPLREQLAPVVGVRALLPVVRATSKVVQRRALNSDEKTIAMITVDKMALTQPRQATLPPRVTVGPLRGYQAQAGKLADALAGVPGLVPAAHSPYESALAAAGRKPGDYTSKIDVHLSADMPAAHALAVVLRRLLDTVEANVSGTIRDIDTEFLHDLRVAVRRTRSVLKTAGSVLPGSIVTRYGAEFKWLGDLTTPTRDLDVYLMSYPAMAGQLVAADEEELRPFHDYLAQQRATAQRQLVRGLRSVRFVTLRGRWRRELDEIASDAVRRPQAGKFAAARIGRAHHRVLVLGGAIGPSSAPQALHDLRKRCKELRYLLEVFASLHDPAAQWRAVNELKALQDCLGEFQDTEVERLELRDFAARMMAARSAPAQTLLAMGEIAAVLATRQARARGEFGGRFAAFSSPRGQARFAALTGAPLAGAPS